MALLFGRKRERVEGADFMILSPKAAAHREEVVTVFKNQTPVAWYANLAKPSNCYSNEPPPATLNANSVTRFQARRRLNKQDKLLTYVIGYQCLIEQVLYKFYIKLHYAKSSAGCEPEVEKRCTQEALQGARTVGSPLTAQVFDIGVTFASGGSSTEAVVPTEWAIHPVVTIRLTKAGEKFVAAALADSLEHLQQTFAKWNARLLEAPVGAAHVDQAANPRQIEKFYLTEPPRAQDGSESRMTPVCARINNQASEIVQYMWDVPLYVLFYSLAQALGQNIPQSFLPCSENEEWRERLASKRMSVYGRIVNNTKYKLVLDELTSVVDCSLIGWPAPVISPMGFAEFGVANGKFSARSMSCEFVYVVVGRDSCYTTTDRIVFATKLTSTQPSPKLKGVAQNVEYPDSQYPLKIEVCTECINAATVIFRVFDPVSPPYLTIIDCVPSAMAPTKCARMPCCGRPNFSEQIIEWRNSVVVAPPIFTGAESLLSRQFSLGRSSPKRIAAAARAGRPPNLASLISKKLMSDYASRERLELNAITNEEEPIGITQDPEPNVIALANGLWWTDIQTNMCSAKRFTLPPLQQLLIDSRISNTPAPSPANVGADNASEIGSEYKSALLRYKIGCEVFCRVLDVRDWQALVFNTALPGAIPSTPTNSQTSYHSLLGTELVRLDRIIPTDYVPELTKWLKKLLKGELGGPSLKQQYLQHYVRSEVEVHAKTAHALLFLTAKVLNEYEINRAAGATRSAQPRPTASGDIRSALDATYSHWETDFATKFPETRALFEPIQDLSSFWLTQNLGAIDQELISRALKSAATIADRLGKPDVVESLKTIIDDPINRGLAWLTRMVH